MEVATKEAIDEAERFLRQLKDELQGSGGNNKKLSKTQKGMYEVFLIAILNSIY